MNDLKSLFENKTILVFGPGTIGTEIISQVLKYNPKRIRIFCNDEDQLVNVRIKFIKFDKKLRMLLGDIRDLERVRYAIKGCDIVFNAAAYKHVPIGEFNPMEVVTTNIIGLENIIKSSFEFGVNYLVQISTDKAVSPSTVMGASKMIGEQLCISRELAKGYVITKIYSVRFGNVLGSRGSIIPLIKKQIKVGNEVTLTHPKMNRFFMSISQAVNLILKTLLLAGGGEIFVLKMPVVNIKDLIEVIIKEYAPKIGKFSDDIKIKIIGIRSGEKLDEELISPIEFSRCYKIENLFCIYPTDYFGKVYISNNITKKGNLIDIEKFKYNTKNIIKLDKKEIKKILYENDLL